MELRIQTFGEEKGVIVKLECAGAAQVRKDFEFFNPITWQTYRAAAVAITSTTAAVITA